MTPTSMRRLLKSHWFGGTWGENLVVRIVYGHVHYCSPQKLMLKVCIPTSPEVAITVGTGLCACNMGFDSDTFTEKMLKTAEN